MKTKLKLALLLSAFSFQLSAFSQSNLTDMTLINLGTAPYGTGGDNARTAFSRANTNFIVLSNLWATGNFGLTNPVVSNSFDTFNLTLSNSLILKREWRVLDYVEWTSGFPTNTVFPTNATCTNLAGPYYNDSTCNSCFTNSCGVRLLMPPGGTNTFENPGPYASVTGSSCSNANGNYYPNTSIPFIVADAASFLLTNSTGFKMYYWNGSTFPCSLNRGFYGSTNTTFVNPCTNPDIQYGGEFTTTTITNGQFPSGYFSPGGGCSGTTIQLFLGTVLNPATSNATLTTNLSIVITPPTPSSATNNLTVGGNNLTPRMYARFNGVCKELINAPYFYTHGFLGYDSSTGTATWSDLNGIAFLTMPFSDASFWTLSATGNCH